MFSGIRGEYDPTVDLVERPPEDSHRHPWEIARSKFIIKLLLDQGLTTYATWLDVGSGDVWLAKRISRTVTGLTRFVGWDINFSDDDLSTLAGDSSIELLSEKPSGKFDMILMLDVLEHIEQDRPFLQDIVEHNLNDHGRILITVPTYQLLYSQHDRILRHFRRYSPESCNRLISECDLKIVSRGGLYSSLLILRIFQKLREVLGSKQDEIPASLWNHGTLVTNAISLILGIEGRFDYWYSRKSKMTLPGLSYWVLCEKK